MSTPSSTVLNPELVGALKRLKLGRIADTLPERLVLADKQEMSFDDLLLLVLTDEIARRDNTAADLRASEARLDPAMRLETWDKTSKVSFDKRMLAELTSLRFLEAHRHVVVLGPVGVGKTFVSQALGHIACRHVSGVSPRNAGGSGHTAGGSASIAGGSTSIAAGFARSSAGDTPERVSPREAQAAVARGASGSRGRPRRLRRPRGTPRRRRERPEEGCGRDEDERTRSTMKSEDAVSKPGRANRQERRMREGNRGQGHHETGHEHERRTASALAGLRPPDLQGQCYATGGGASGTGSAERIPSGDTFTAKRSIHPHPGRAYSRCYYNHPR
jgi:hypothetical protein